MADKDLEPLKKNKKFKQALKKSKRPSKKSEPLCKKALKRNKIKGRKLKLTSKNHWTKSDKKSLPSSRNPLTWKNKMNL